MPLLADLFTSPLDFFVVVIALLIALTVHEAAHAYVARLLGDPTAEHQGRLTLNPLAHLDPIGTIAILLVGIGWGKPVPVDMNNFKQPKLDNLKVALAGPISNLLLACFFALLARITQPDPSSIVAVFTSIIVQLNLALMFFNLIPLPPLDGSKVIALFMYEETFMRFERNGFYILVALLALGWFGFPLISRLIYGPTQLLYNVLLGGLF